MSQAASSSSTPPTHAARAWPTQTSGAHAQPSGGWSYAAARQPAWAVSGAAAASPTLPYPAAKAAAHAPIALKTQAGPNGAGREARRARRRRDRTAEDEAAMQATAARVAARLEQDVAATLRPAVDTPFADGEDVVRRLLPYHIWQYPAEDVGALAGSGKGKGKRRAAAELREEIADTRTALECARRQRALEERFRRARIKAGTRDAADDMAYVLAQAVLDTERAEGTNLNAELREARNQLDQLWPKKAAPARAPAGAAPSQTPAFSHYQHYSYAPAGGYPYGYSTLQTSGGAGVQSMPASRTASSSSAAGSRADTPPTSATPTGSGTPAGAAATPLVQPLTAGFIPVQLPVSALAQLTALGVLPIAAERAGAGRAAAPAVLTGTSRAGTMLTMQINVGMLSAAQAQGLAALLTALSQAREAGGA